MGIILDGETADPDARRKASSVGLTPTTTRIRRGRCYGADDSGAVDKETTLIRPSAMIA